jgi:hypothetical protein
VPESKRKVKRRNKNSVLQISSHDNIFQRVKKLPSEEGKFLRKVTKILNIFFNNNIKVKRRTFFLFHFAERTRLYTKNKKYI